MHFNQQTYPNSFWDSVSDFARVANILANLIRNKFEKIEEPTPDQIRRFARLTEYECSAEEVKALIDLSRKDVHVSPDGVSETARKSIGRNPWRPL